MGSQSRHNVHAARHTSSAVVLAVVTLAFLLVPTSANAATMTVASGLVHIADDGQCSLREAINNAQTDEQPNVDCPAGSGADVITLEGGVYHLGAGEHSAFWITSDITLVGAGSAARGGDPVRGGGGPTVLDAGGARRHFYIPGAGFDPDPHHLHLEGMQLTNGAADRGGAVLSSAGFSATDVRFTGNVAETRGGAIATTSKLISGLHTNEHWVTLIDSFVTGNEAEYGAAISTDGGSLTLFGTTVSHNVASDGSTINSAWTTIAIRGSAIRDNTGVGLWNNLGDVDVEASTISGNVGWSAGGIVNTGGGVCHGSACNYAEASLTVRDSTISGNTATADHGAGAIRSSDGDWGGTDAAALSLTNVTIAGNEAPGAQLRAEAATLHNTVIADAVGGTDCQAADADGGPAWQGHHNVSEQPCDTGGFTQVANALLGPLAFNGGPTATHLPHPASPLVDAGDQPACDAQRRMGADTDQRGAGFPRTVGDACDIGAVEADVPGLVWALAADVSQLTFRGGPEQRHEGRRTSLLAKLEAAGDAVERGDDDAAEGQLGAFTNQVEAYAGDSIMEEDAHRLVRGALAIIGLLPEDGVPPDGHER